MTARILHFTIGPVQDFIEQARRTRDFWAGSFILSLLSGHAMKALKDAGGVIVFPDINGDDLFEALPGGRREPYVGSLPNRFKANIDKVKGDAGGICKKAVDDAWATICEAVRKHLFEHKEVHPDVQKRKKACRAVWDRQVLGFWDMSWVTGPEPADHSDGAWLDLRKNFRSHLPTTEGGDHCRLMGQYQEISGYDRLTERGDQQIFWQALSKGRELDLRPDERLCAIALVKRFFPVVADANKGIGGAMPFVPGGESVSTRFWPSTSYIAALPWLRQVDEKWDVAILEALPAAAKDAFKSGYKGETDTKLYRLPDRDLFKLDGHLLHVDGIEANLREEFPKDLEARKQPKENLTKALTALAAAVGKISKPARTDGKDPKPIFASEFYAILRMDGDGVGKAMTDPKNVPVVKNALSEFTKSVGEYFDPKHNNSFGALIYAGGDDVLALLPVDTAIEAACRLKGRYDDAFKQALKESGGEAKEFTISASIIYSHFKNPLSAALRQSAVLLDDIAKEKNGRSSLALAVMKPGGLAAQWVSTFGSAVVHLENLTKGAWGTHEDAGLSGGFFHGLKQNCQPLFTDADGKSSDFSDDHMLRSLVMAEMLNQFRGKDRRKAASKMIEPVMAILRPHKRGKDGVPLKAEGVAFDGGLMVRFLRNERREVKTS